MNKTIKIVIGAVVVILIIGFAWYFQKSQKQNENKDIIKNVVKIEDIKIGAILDLTSPLASYGVEYKRGL